MGLITALLLLGPDPGHAGEGTDMGSSSDMQTASAEQLKHVLGAAHIMIVDHEPSSAGVIASVLKRYGATTIERAATADEALDMLGYTTRAYDLVMLRAGLPGDEAVRILRVLSRQRASARVTLHGGSDLRSLREPQWYAGVARCIEVSGLPGIVRGVAIVLASDATLANIIRTSIVPETISADWAEAIYGALPQHPTRLPLKP
jgi:DNA-binding NarL/FixJ family response regulator